MTFPLLPGKHAGEAVVTARDYMAYLRTAGFRPEGPAPRAAVLCFSPDHFAAVTATVPGRPWDWGGTGAVHVLDGADGAVAAVGGFGIGAPAAATVIEELVACGVRHLVTVGSAGSVQARCVVGDVVVGATALRDEGTSHHYLPPGEEALPSEALTAALAGALDRAGVAHHTGTTWSTDAVYRETVEEVRRHRADGVLTVEMEAAGVFAVARHLGVEAAAALVVTDTLADLTWAPRFHGADVEVVLDRVFSVVAGLLAERAGGPGTAQASR